MRYELAEEEFDYWYAVARRELAICRQIVLGMSFLQEKGT